MNFFDYKATRVWFDDGKIWVQLIDGRTSNLPLASFKRLAKATSDQLNQFEIVDGYAVHWPALDEDLSVAGFFESIKIVSDSATLA